MHVCRLYYIVYDEVVVATGSIMAVQQRDEISGWGTPKFYVHQKCKCELVSLTGKTERMRRLNGTMSPCGAQSSSNVYF